MSVKQLIKDYMAANPKAKPKEIALACGCSVHTVYNRRAEMRAKLKSSLQSASLQSDAKLVAERDKVIETMAQTTNLLLQKIEKLMDENQLYARRETKLMGVIDYLESKVDGLAI